MQVYIEKITKDGFNVVARGNIDDILPEYEKRSKNNEPVHLCLDCSGMADMPDFANPLTQAITKAIGVKVIDYDGTIAQTEEYKQKIKEVFQDD